MSLNIFNAGEFLVLSGGDPQLRYKCVQKTPKSANEHMHAIHIFRILSVQVY